MAEQLPSVMPAARVTGTLAGWTFGAIAAAAGLSAVGQGQAAPGAVFLLAAVLAMPPVLDFTQRRLGFAIGGWFRVAAYVVIVLAGGALLPLTPPKPGQTTEAASDAKPAAPKQQAAGRSRGEEAPAAPEQAPSGPPGVLLDIRGSGTRSTQKFTTHGSDWTIRWSYDCSNVATGLSSFIVDVTRGDGDATSMQINQLGERGEDTDYYHQAGTYYLEINSGCRWHITASDAP